MPLLFLPQLVSTKVDLKHTATQDDPDTAGRRLHCVLAYFVPVSLHVAIRRFESDTLWLNSEKPKAVFNPSTTSTSITASESGSNSKEVAMFDITKGIEIVSSALLVWLFVSRGVSLIDPYIACEFVKFTCLS